MIPLLGNPSALLRNPAELPPGSCGARIPLCPADSSRCGSGLRGTAEPRQSGASRHRRAVDRRSAGNAPCGSGALGAAGRGGDCGGAPCQELRAATRDAVPGRQGPGGCGMEPRNIGATIPRHYQMRRLGGGRSRTGVRAGRTAITPPSTMCATATAPGAKREPKAGSSMSRACRTCLPGMPGLAPHRRHEGTAPEPARPLHRHLQAPRA